MPRTMRGAILTELRKPLIVEEITLPESLEAGQVLVKIKYSGICGSQLGEIDGVKGKDPYLPHLLGHEASGTVIEVGPGVSQVNPEDNVVLHWRKGSGNNSETPIYKWKDKKLNAGCITTFNEYAIVSENRCTPIPSESDLEVATLFGCAVTTGFGVVENNAKVCIGESVVVYGAGGIGLNIVQAASLVSAYPIIAVDLYQNRLELAREMGATHILDGKAENIEMEILKANDNNEVDVFIDNTGNTKIIEMGYNITKPTGRITLVGVPNNSNNINIHSLPLHFGKVLSGSHGGDGKPHLDIHRYHNLYRKGLIKLSGIITERFKLTEINNALDDMRSGKSKGRIIIEM